MLVLKKRRGGLLGGGTADERCFSFIANYVTARGNV